MPSRARLSGRPTPARPGGRSRVGCGAHDLLTRDTSDSAPLARLAADVLRMDGPNGQRVTLSGPGVVLLQKQAVAITLALHELFTNALKYGALSVDGGGVALEWQRTENRDARLCLTWTDSGGPPVSAPRRRGFGSSLIERALAHDGDATVTMEYPETGVTCTIDVPLPPLAGQ